MLKKFNEFVKDNLEEGYLRRIISSEINKEERTEDKIKRERNEKIEKIKSWLDEMGVENYSIDDISLKIDVDGSVDLDGEDLDGEIKKGDEEIVPKIEGGKLPDYIKFRKVYKSFWCSKNKLTSLEGCPEEVGGSFDCSYNQLTSLKHCPTKIYGDFYCYNNRLTSLEHCPKEIGGSFDCPNNHLVSLKHCPIEIKGYFNCGNNKLTSLEYCPEKIDDYFYCVNNPLVSLKYCPKKVGWNFTCSCDNLEDFEFITGYKERVDIGNNFICYRNNENNKNIEIDKKKCIDKHFDVGGCIYFKNKD